MSQAVRITSACKALRSPGGEVLRGLEPGTEYLLLRDDDRHYYKIVCDDRVAYVPKKLGTLIERPRESFPHASYVGAGTDQAGWTPPRVLRLAAATLGVLTLALAALAGAGETDPPGYNAVIALIILFLGGTITAFTFALSLVIGPPGRARGLLRRTQRALLALSAGALVLAFVFFVGTESVSAIALVLLVSALVAGGLFAVSLAWSKA